MLIMVLFRRLVNSSPNTHQDKQDDYPLAMLLQIAVHHLVVEEEEAMYLGLKLLLVTTATTMEATVATIVTTGELIAINSNRIC